MPARALPAITVSGEGKAMSDNGQQTAAITHRFKRELSPAGVTNLAAVILPTIRPPQKSEFIH